MKKQFIHRGANPMEAWSAERVKALTMNKISGAADDSSAERYTVLRRHGRRFAIVATAAVLALSLATAALAASGVIDLGAFYNSIFNNSKATPYVKTGDEITTQVNDGDVTVELLAGFLESARSGAYVQMRIQDPTGTKLSESLIFINNGNTLNTGSVSVRMEDANTAVASMFITPVNAAGGEVKLSFDTIASGIQSIESESTDFNIGGYVGMSKPVLVPGAEFIEVTGITLNDGELTIAHRNSDAAVYGWGLASLSVQKPDGEMIRSTHGSAAVGVPGQSDCFDIGELDPNGLTLVWSGIRAANTMTGDWEFSISSENTVEPRIIEGTFDNHIAQAVIGATSIEIRIHADYINNNFPYDYTADSALEILLADGTSVQTEFNGSMNDQTLATFGYTVEFINPDETVSVTFCGETLEGLPGMPTD